MHLIVYAIYTNKSTLFKLKNTLMHNIRAVFIFSENLTLVE